MTLSRRRFLTLASAAALAAPGIARAYRSQSIALGARVQIVLDHPRAPAVTARALGEINRLEDIFSLYRSGSALCRLNATGVLIAPPFELLECLARARRVHRLTAGRFDPTVQPLWRVLAEAGAAGGTPDADALARARALIGFDRIRFDSARIALGPGQALTLNGIAQGFIADRVADLMQAEGIDDVLVDTGEIVALGSWPVGFAGSLDRIAVTNRAVATSAYAGTMIGPEGRFGHILCPVAGMPRRPGVRSLSISAPSAALADALSTSLCLANSPEEVAASLRNLKDVRLENIQMEGDQ